MKNWSTDVKRLRNRPKEYALWKLEQKINFGLDGKKLSEKLLRKYFKELSIDPLKKIFLKHLLWPTRS